MRTYIKRLLHFCICPGNHDIDVRDKNKFSAFDRFAISLAGDSRFTFSKRTSRSATYGNTDVIAVNTVYHGDHTYGEIDLDELCDNLKKSKAENRIIICHHHLIPVTRKNKSQVVNAYLFLQLVSEFKVSAILHGHIHMSSVLSFGEYGCRIVGVSSLLFPPISNINNQFNLLKFDGGKLSEGYNFRYIRDGIHKGQLGYFERNAIKLL